MLSLRSPWSRGTVTRQDVCDKVITVALRCGESVVNWPFAAICRLSRLGVRRLGLVMINMYTKFEISGLSCSRDIWGLKIKNGWRLALLFIPRPQHSRPKAQGQGQRIPRPRNLALRPRPRINIPAPKYPKGWLKREFYIWRCLSFLCCR